MVDEYSLTRQELKDLLLACTRLTEWKLDKMRTDTMVHILKSVKVKCLTTAS